MRKKTPFSFRFGVELRMLRRKLIISSIILLSAFASGGCSSDEDVRRAEEAPYQKWQRPYDLNEKEQPEIFKHP